MSPCLRSLPALAAALTLGFGVVATGLPRQAAADAQVPASISPSAHGFEDFCRTWMRKLAQREKRNLGTAQVRKQGDSVVLSYVGYAAEPRKCSARKSGVAGNPYVGKMVYLEYAYERHGKSRKAALSAEPKVVKRTEVLEIFRHDGSKWVY